MFLYHAVHDQLQGDTLYPLKQLKEVNAALYEEAIKKYDDRKELLTRYVKVLDCYWGDVIFLSPIHPQDIKDAIIEAGFPFKKKTYWYEFPLDMFDHSNLAVTDGKTLADMEDEVEFDIGVMDKINKITSEQKDYYKRCISEGKRPLILGRSPHILYKGSISIKDIKILEI